MVVAITIVCRPYHGPCVNVEKAATRARRVDTITNSPTVAAGLASLHAVRDSAIIQAGYAAGRRIEFFLTCFNQNEPKNIVEITHKYG